MAAKSSSKPLTPSQAAKDDVMAVVNGGAGGSFALNVLANDPGSARLYSLFQQIDTLGKKAAVPVVTSVTLASGAVVSIQPDGTLAYAPPADAPAGWTETFTYIAQMANGTLSAAKVTLSVAGPANHAPVLGAVDPLRVLDDAAAAAPQVLNGMLRATDADGDGVTFALASGSPTASPYGTLRLQPDGTFSFTADPAALDALAAGETATVSFWAVATDVKGAASDPKEIRIELVGADEVRLALADDHFDAANAGIDEDRVRVTLDVLANDSAGTRIHSVAQAGDGVATSAILNSGAVVTVQADGTVALDYDATSQFYNLQGMNEGQVWRDSFRYVAQLADGSFATANVTVEVAGRNDAPVLRAVEAVTIADDGDEAADLQITGQLAVHDEDVGDSAWYALAPGEDGIDPFGSLVLQANGQYVFTLDGDALDALAPGQYRDVLFSVQAFDELGAASGVRQIRYYLTGADETSRTAADDFIPAALSGLDAHHLQGTLDVLGNDPAGAQVVSLVQQAWQGGDSSSFPLVTSATTANGGTLVLQADGTIAYDLQNQYYNLMGLAAGQNWTESFLYTIRSASGELSTARVTVEVAGVNDAARVDTVETAVIHDDAGAAGALLLSGQLTATDPDAGASLHFDMAPGASGDSTYGSFALETDGRYTFTLNPAALDALESWETQTVPFYVVAVDEHGLRSAAQPVWFHLVGAAELVGVGEPLGG
jgi:VCBS repeat-containing protein